LASISTRSSTIDPVSLTSAESSHHVEDDEIGVKRSNKIAAGRAVSGIRDLVAVGPEMKRQHLPNVPLIIDHGLRMASHQSYGSIQRYL
jgi:hypothetical protein